jgi:hypothetical protein
LRMALYQRVSRHPLRVLQVIFALQALGMAFWVLGFVIVPALAKGRAERNVASAALRRLPQPAAAE